MKVMRLIGVLALSALCIQCAQREKGDVRDRRFFSAKKTSSKKEPEAVGTKVGKLTVDADGKTVSGMGKICLARGVLEYAIISNGGKAYESVIEMDVRPSDLHAALLMIGGTPGWIPEEFMGDEKGTAAAKQKKPAASKLEIFVEWTVDGQTRNMRVEELLFNRDKSGPGNEFEWAFTGSFFGKDAEGKELYVADIEKSIVALWYDSSALLNLAAIAKNPYRGGGFGFEINEKKVPKEGTPVRVIFKLKKAAAYDIQRNLSR